MFYNFADTQTLFEEFKLDENKLTNYRQRLLALFLPSFSQEEREEEADVLDLNDFYLVRQDTNKVVILVPSLVFIDIPDMYVLSDDRDYQMTTEEVIVFLTDIYENHPERELTNLSYKDDGIPSALVRSIRQYLLQQKDTRQPVPNAPLESYTLNQDVVLRLLRVILATVYNYHEPYKFTMHDLFWL